MNEKDPSPARYQVNTDLDPETAEILKKIHRDYGPKPPAVVRLALADFLPRYVAANGRIEDMEFFTLLGAALKKNPGLKAEIEKLTRGTLRAARKVA